MKTEVLIIGGGIPGLTLAVLLGQAGLEVAIVDTEKLQVSGTDIMASRTVALMDGSIRTIQKTGIWEAIKDKACPLKTMKLVDDSSKNLDVLEVEFHASEIGLEAFGRNIPHSAIRAALVEKISALNNITLIAPARLASYRIEGMRVHATLDTGKEIEAALIIGADGRNSVTREQAGIKADMRESGQSAITCLISHTKPHNFTSTEHHRTGGPFTIVPMPDREGKHLSAIVWMERETDVQKFLALDKASFTQALQDRSRNSIGTITLESAPVSWPIITLKARNFTAPRCAIVAEAAHVISPIGAQGLNLSLRDVAGLADVIIEAALVGQDIGSTVTLDRYEKIRRFDINTRVYGVDAFNRIVGNNLSSLRGLRRLGLKTLQNSPLLRNFIMQEGLSK